MVCVNGPSSESTNLGFECERHAFLGQSIAASLAATLSPISILAEPIPASVAASLGDVVAKSIQSGACPGVAISLTHKGSPVFSWWVRFGQSGDEQPRDGSERVSDWVLNEAVHSCGSRKAVLAGTAETRRSGQRLPVFLCASTARHAT
jgi:hypothetical protein